MKAAHPTTDPNESRAQRMNARYSRRSMNRGFWRLAISWRTMTGVPRMPNIHKEDAGKRHLEERFAMDLLPLILPWTIHLWTRFHVTDAPVSQLFYWDIICGHL